MDYNEINLEAVEREIKAIVARFANDVNKVYIDVAKGARNEEYLKVYTDNIRMTPCVFKSLRIEGEGYLLKDESDNDILSFNLHWRWNHHKGGSNGTELISFSMFVPNEYGSTLIMNMRF